MPVSMYAISPLSSSPLPCTGRNVLKQGIAFAAAKHSCGTARTSSISSFTPESAGDSLHKLYNLSGSRHGASSPTQASSINHISLGGAVSVVGFSVGALPCVVGALPTPAHENTGAFLPPKAPQTALRPAAGLLSRALTALPEEALPEPSLSFLSPSFKREAGQQTFFPDVDTSLLRDAQERHAVFKSELVATAFMLASKAHGAKTRRDGTSRLSHCLLTASSCADLGLDAECVAAALLHDALEDMGDAFRSQMEEFLPRSVVQMVDRVATISDISTLYRHHRASLSDEKLRRMLLAMEDVKAVLVQLACRVHAMRGVALLPREEQVSLAQETLDIFSVVANRLGVWCLKAQLEDLAFGVLHPQEYAELKEQVARRQDPAALEGTVQRIKLALDAAGVRYEDISGRPKNLYGVWCKMRDSGLKSVDDVYDVTALRVVVATKLDCYRVQRAVLQLYRCMPGRSKDYILLGKKPNGYQSLHETVYGEGGLPIEVQIRTHKMHYIAEYGFAAHWKYKEKLSDEDEWLEKEVQYKKWLTAYKLGVHDKKVRHNGSPTDTALHSLGMHLLEAAGLTPRKTPPPPRPSTSAPASLGLPPRAGAAGAKRAAAAAASFSSASASSSAAVAGAATGRAAARRHAAAGKAGAAAPGEASDHSASGSSSSSGFPEASDLGLVVDPFLRLDRFRLQAPKQAPVAVVVQTRHSIEARELPPGYPAVQLSVDLGVHELPGYALTVNQRLPAVDQPLRSGDLVQVVPLAEAVARSPPRGQLLDVYLPGVTSPVRVQAGASGDASSSTGVSGSWMEGGDAFGGGYGGAASGLGFFAQQQAFGWPAASAVAAAAAAAAHA